MKQDRFLSMAKKVSHKSTHRQYKHGCVIVRGNKVLGSGFNINRTHPKSPHDFKHIHAEFMAAMNTGYDLQGATVYIFRQHKNGAWANSKPCESCWKFLIDCGAKEVVYSFEGTLKKEGLGK